MNKQDYMLRAIQLAKQAVAEDEVPVGAVVVSADGEIIAEAYNQSAHSGDATAHAEILAIQRACAKLKTTRLWDCDMYVSLEPCTMCAAAISFARIKNLYFGATDEKGGAVISGVKFYDSPTCHHKPEVKGGICAAECGKILKDFFKAKREK
jgi:tRNA(Arg) A34 adenosine deaminase TadA